MTGEMPLLILKDFALNAQGRTVVGNFTLSLQPGETLVLLGEPGSGKDAVLQALAGYSVRGEELTGSVTVRGAAVQRWRS